MTSQHSAYFIGIALPPELSDQIFTLKSELFDNIDQALKPLTPHVTLFHPSNLREIPPCQLLSEIRKIASPYLPLSLRLINVHHFDKEVLFIKVNSPELEILQAKLVQLLPEKDQVVYKKRGYTPHITLAQVRAPHTLDVEGLTRVVSPHLSLPRRIAVNTISCFTQIAPREYRSESI